MAIAAFTFVFVVAKKIRSLYGTAIKETPLSSKMGLSRYSLVATTWEQ
jgi:hypothetical protein